MTWLAAVARLLGRRGALVLGTLALAALVAGVGSVLAGGGPNGITVHVNGPVARGPATVHTPGGGKVLVGHSYKNDVSRPLRSVRAAPLVFGPEKEASPNPRPVST